MIFNQKVTALVPIKGHSERVPGKNLRDFAARPLMCHILSTLENTFAVDQVIVDTDSEEVAGHARAFSKVQVLDRPEKLRGDMVSMNEVIAHDILQCPSDIFLQTHATNPLLKPETVSEALRTFVKSEQHDSLFSVTPMHVRLFDRKGNPINHDPKQLIRTQDMEPVFEENSCIYVFTKQSFEKNQPENRSESTFV